MSDLRDALADAKGDLDDTSDAFARLSQALQSSEPLDRDVAQLVQTTLDAKGQELAQAEAETEKQADEALRREEGKVAEKRNAVEGAADEVAALAPKVAEAERIQREADDQLRKLRNATDASLTQAKKKVDDQNKRLDDFRSERGARTHDQVIKKCVEDERRLADEIEETQKSLNLLEGNEDDERELGVLEHAATQCLDRFSEAYSRDAADLREAAEDYEQDGGSGAVVPEPPSVDQGPEFADRLKSLISSAKSRLDDAKATASSLNASTKADERSAQQAEASARAASREASRACDALPSDTRAKLASIKKKCAALKDAEKAAAEDVEDEGEDEVKAVEELYKAADDLNVFEWARIDKGDDDLALETLVATPLAQSKPDAFQATAAFVRGITAVVARRKESATMIPEAMGYLLKKLQTKTNKHTGCKQCPVCKRRSGKQISGHAIDAT